MRENTVRSIFAQTSFGKIYNYIIGYHPTKPKLTHDAKISFIMRCNTWMPIQFLYTTYIIGPPYSSSSCLSVGDSRAKKQGLCLLADKNSLGIVVYIYIRNLIQKKNLKLTLTGISGLYLIQSILQDLFLAQISKRSSRKEQYHYQIL